MIEIKNVSLGYEDEIILKDVNLKILNNEIIGLYGENGCGKTTFSKYLVGLKKANGGELLIDDEIITKIDPRIQLIMQQPESSFDPTQKLINSFRELIKYYKLCKDKLDMEKLIDEVCKKVEINKDILFHYPYQISGGEAERIALARALLIKPKLIILDESTSMLDDLSESLIIDLIKKLKNEENISFIFILHDLKILKKTSDKIYEIKNKQLILKED